MKAKGSCTQDSDSNPSAGEQRRCGGYCNWCWRNGYKEAQSWFEQKCTKSNPPDPLQRDIREWTNPAENRRGHNQLKKGKGNTPGKGNRNQDQVGFADEGAGQRRSDDFGTKRLKVEFVDDVQEHSDGFENAQCGSSSLRAVVTVAKTS